MGTLWIPGAERITPSAAGGTITSTAPPRVVWHTTEATPGTSAVWTSMIRVLTNKAAEPHVLYDPVTDRLGQFFPLNVSGRALKNDGTTRTNRVGKVCIQVEVIAYSAKPFTAYWKPGPNWRSLMAAIRSWGIPDMQPAGAFPAFIDNPPHNVPENDRDRPTWLSKAGHFSHSQIPGNDHGDPGAVSFPAMLAAGKPTTSTGGTSQPPAGQEDDMPYTETQLRAMIQAELEEFATRHGVDDVDEKVWNRQIADVSTPESGDTSAAATLLTWTASRAAEQAVASLKPQLDALTAQVQALADKFPKS